MSEAVLYCHVRGFRGGWELWTNVGGLLDTPDWIDLLSRICTLLHLV